MGDIQPLTSVTVPLQGLRLRQSTLQSSCIKKRVLFHTKVVHKMTIHISVLIDGIKYKCWLYATFMADPPPLTMAGIASLWVNKEGQDACYYKYNCNDKGNFLINQF